MSGVQGGPGSTLAEQLEFVSRLLRCEVDFDNAEQERAFADQLAERARVVRERLEFLRAFDDPRMAAWRLQVLGELEVLTGPLPGPPTGPPPTEAPRCETWCGQSNGGILMSGKPSLLFCTPACRDAAKPLRPAEPKETP